ncbi:unnamed protein product [Closterium sp. NIES-64]|nr:unnamed protein product [Closterium sp. NIES-64]
MASSPQPPHPAAPDTRGVGPARRTAASNTSPHALRTARRGKESHPHEQQREDLVGRVGITAPGEAAGEQESVEGEAAAAAAAGGSGAMGTESEAAVAVEAAAAAGLEGVAAEATEMVAAAELGGPDAASGGGSASPTAIPQAWQPEELGPPVAQERTEAVVLAASPEPVTASVLAAAVTAATGEQDGARTEEGAPVAAANAETSAAAEGASTQGHDLGGVVDRVVEPARLPAPPAGRRSFEPSQHRGGPEQGWDLVPRDPSWAGFCKGSCHKGKSVTCHLQGLARQRRCWRRGSRREDRNMQAEASRTPALGGEKRLAEQGEECEGPEGDGAEEARLSAEGSRS